MKSEFLKAVINSHIGKRQIEPMTQGVAQKKVSLGRPVGNGQPSVTGFIGGACTTPAEDGDAEAINAYRLLIVDEIGELPMSRETSDVMPA